MENEKFMHFLSEIFTIIIEEKFLICQIGICDCLVFNIEKNMYQEFMIFYANKSLLKTFWELRFLGLGAFKQATLEYFAVERLIRSLI